MPTVPRLNHLLRMGHLVGDKTHSSAIARLYVQFQLYHRRKLYMYDHPPNPLVPIYTSPDQIETFTSRKWPPWKNKKNNLGTIVGGDWDKTEPKLREGYGTMYDLFRGDTFTDSTFYQALHEHFIDGVEWTETEFVRECFSLADDGIPNWKGYDSREEILRHCKSIDELYNNIRNNGYKSQAELQNTSPYRVLNEIGVDIGRNGKLLFVASRHRLAIAKILNLDRIPVCVYVRHKKWMDKRKSLIESGSESGHPDLNNTTNHRSMLSYIFDTASPS